MHYNILIGGAAGQGVDTTASVLVKLLKSEGYAVFTNSDFMSRIRGGHNFILIRFGDNLVHSHSLVLDGLVALDDDTVTLHTDQLKPNGFILCDEKIKTDDKRAIKVPLIDMAKQLGNPRVSGSVANSVILRLFNLSLDNVKTVLIQELAEKYLYINIEAFKKGYELVESRYPKLEADFSRYMLISGNKALALGALASGLKFYSAYPMSPSTSIMEFLAEHGKDLNVVVEQAEDEIAAINMAIGASFTGVRAMTGTSGGGFALMVEALGLSGIAEIPLVVVDVQRPGPATGLPTRTEQSDLRFVIHASQGEFPRKVVAIRHHEDAYRQTIKAFETADKYQTPVIILSDQFLGDGLATIKPVTLPEKTPSSIMEIKGEYKRYLYTEDGISPRLYPGQTKHLVYADSDEHDEQGLITESGEVRNKMMDKRMRKLQGIIKELEEPDFFGSENSEVLLIGWGSTWGPIKEAIELLNQKAPNKYSALVFGDVYPLPEKLLKKHAKTAKVIINVEQNATGQLAGLIRETTGIVCTNHVLKYDGRQITADEIVVKVMEVNI
ncbi:MAG: 2-oxoacid:acceptor oxidoreductase subunit alpha [Erysipelotrichaceae bacterium]|nr:2-oxoacid:acceptor oxidoreductase subunit alpha [Erysipelotrichaceae bacterium]